MAAAQEPTFRSEISYVQLPVRVIDARGEFVSGLAQSDFQVFEDRVPQTITAFTAVDIPAVDVDPSVPDTPLSSADTVASNEHTEVDGRVYLFVLDNQTMDAATSLRTRHVVRGFIQDHIKANDIVGIVMTGTGRGQHLTRNRRLLDEAIDRFMSDANPNDDQSYRVLNFVGETAAWMGSIKGRRKALVLVTGSPLCPLIELEQEQSELSSCAESLRNVLRRTMEADVSIYTIDPRGLVAISGVPVERPDGQDRYPVITRGPFDAARQLAEQSGGFALVNTNSLSAGFARIARENSSYYILGYYSTNNRADGKLRRNEVRVSRRGTQLVYRSGYLAPRASDGKASIIAPSVPTITQQLRELAKSPLPVSTMVLRVAAAPFLFAGGQARVAVVVEMPHDTLKPTIENDQYRLNVGISIGFYDRAGRSLGGDDPNIELTLPVKVAPRITAEGIRMVSRVAVPPGTHRLWVGAVQPQSGVRGSVITEIDVPDFDRQPLSMSGIALTTNVASRMYTARTDGLLDDVLGGPPTASREFPADSDLWVYGEIYDHRSNAGDVTAKVTVTSVGGKVVYETPLEPAPVQFGHLAKIPLKELGPGSFVATVEARSSTPTPVSAARTVLFRVR